ncbi:MAG: replication initiator [Nocardioidaceae bacterium]
MTATTATPRPAGLSDELLRDTAAKLGVCVRPIIRRVVDTTTGESETVPLPCGSTRERACPPCAQKARRLRVQQCREGWHRTDDPANDDEDQAAGPEPESVEAEHGPAEQASSVRRRSTRRLPQFPPLPVTPMERRTVGRELTSPTGETYRPSTFLTLTLPSYGPVHPDGTPKDPESYDYRRAASDALHFAKLLDRFWQNLRRCAGYKVQYFGCVEPQRRLALHAHAAVRGAIPRGLIREVAAATYEQVWWPPHDTPVYVDQRPVWDERSSTYVDPDTLMPLRSWDRAMDATYDPDAEAAHVVWFGEQVDSQWFIPDSSRTDRRVGYICKYLTKSIAEAYDPDTMSRRQRRHLIRLHREVRWLPCCPECPNWLMFGITPKAPEPGLLPGHCPRPAHQLENLGHGGRRVLVSRDWSGKTLTEHKADRAAIVRAALAEAGIEPPDTDRWSADQTADNGTPRYLWEAIDITPGTDLETYRVILRRQITERLRWQHEYSEAKQALTAARPPDDTHSATGSQPAMEAVP